MKKSILTLSILSAVFCSLSSKAADYSAPPKAKTVAHHRAVVSPASQETLLRLKSFRAYTIARKHHLADLAVEGVR